VNCTGYRSGRNKIGIPKLILEWKKKITNPEQKVKNKAVSLQAWIGPEVSRKLIFPDFLTTTQDGG
jgi:hypothetical protein